MIMMMTLGCYFLMRDFSSKKIQKKIQYKKQKNIKYFLLLFSKVTKITKFHSLFFVFVFHLGDFLFQPFDFIARLLDVG